MMRKAMIGLTAAIGGCLWSGCMSTLTVAEMKWTVASIPEGVWGWTITVPGYHSVSSLDAVQLADALGEVITHIVGMLPLL